MNVKKRNGGEWTEARFVSFIKSILRAGSRRWPPKYATLAEACVGVKLNPRTNRLAKHYKCRACQRDYPAKDVEVNHITSVVPTSGFTSWDDVIERLFCEKEGLEVLCKPCHKLVTKQERLERKVHNEKRV